MSNKYDVETLRKELRYRFQDVLESGQNTDLIEELVSDSYVVDHPLFCRMLSSLQASEVVAGSLTLEGATTSEKAIFPPLTNRGVDTHEKRESLIIVPVSHKPKIMGGYDGGVMVGFMGEWTPSTFKNLKEQLDKAKLSSEENPLSDDKYLILNGRRFYVYPHGANDGAHYKYVIEGDGIKIYIHNNPKGGIQPIRVRYGFESLCGNDLFAVHFSLLDFLKELGFFVKKEIVSRADMQVLFEVDCKEFFSAINEGRCVTRARSFQVHGTSNNMETYTAGQNIQVCIYDKLKELKKGCDELKFRMLIENCLGGELPEHLTRIEFRLRREVLNMFEIHTMKDLLEKENSLVEYLTTDWFRLLENDKQKGHSHEQQTSSLWLEVIERFKLYFPSLPDRKLHVVRRNSKELRCTGESLVKQAAGCLSSVLALTKGVVENVDAALNFVVGTVKECIGELYNRSIDKAKEFGTKRGSHSPDELDWYFNARYAGEVVDVMPDYRILFDEDLMYDRFCNFAVEGCPF